MDASELMKQGRLTVATGQRIRKWGGWYRHDIVSLDGAEIGRVQVRTNGRGGLEAITMDMGSADCVLGRAYDWLVRVNGE